jgi:PAS domain S-box-containing protein
VNDQGEPGIATRLDELDRRLHDAWREAAARAEPVPSLAAVGSAVEDLHVAAEEVSSAAQQLDAERLWYATLFLSAPIASVVTDIQGVITDANEAAAEALGRGADVLVGSNLAAFVGPGDAGTVERLQALCLEHATDLPSAADLVLAGPDGPVRVAVGCRAARDSGGVARGLHWILYDLTDRLRAEGRLREVQDAETGRFRELADHWKQLEGAKTHFLNLASHELRSPLTLLGGYLAMLEAGTFGDLATPARSVISLLAAKTTEMNSLVNDMLESARLEDGTVRLSLARVDVADLTRQVVDDWRPLAGANHRVVFTGPGEPMMVDADAARLRTVIVNVVSNAIKYSPNGGDIECTVARDGARATVSIRDEGIGIASDDRALLFSRFGRVVTPANSHVPGTGLGLYIARELARVHGGDIAVTSAVGKGSRFTITLPLEDSRARG